MGKSKRKRGDASLKDAYENVSITPRESSGRPGTPHRFFKSSFDVQVKKPPKEMDEPSSSCNGHVLVHQHANGLCVVTVGNDTTLRDNHVKEIQFQVQEPPQNMSSNDHRKRQSKLLRGGTIGDSQGLTLPNTMLAQLIMEDGDVLHIPAGVWGTVLEVNTNVTPKLLQDDPLLDGYLAVILPTGSFPPRFRSDKETCPDEARKKAHVAKHDDATTGPSSS